MSDTPFADDVGTGSAPLPPQPAPPPPQAPPGYGAAPPPQSQAASWGQLPPQQQPPQGSWQQPAAPPPQQYGAWSPAHTAREAPEANTAFWLSIAALVTCLGIILGPIALWQASIAREKIRLSGGTLGGESKVNAARVMAIISLVLSGLLVLFVLLGALAGTDSTSNEFGLRWAR